MGLLCLFGHIWNGCKCIMCGELRNEEHSWNGCLCTQCGKHRNEEHNWNGCQCTKCGKIRDRDHDWSKNCETCSICFMTRKQFHKWDGCKCTICGATRNQEHKWVNGICNICGNSVSMNVFIQSLDSFYAKDSQDRFRLEKKLDSDYEIVRTFGEYLIHSGGLIAMQRVWYTIQAKDNDLAIRLSVYWHGIENGKECWLT
jgi:hypothetical protein